MDGFILDLIDFLQSKKFKITHFFKLDTQEHTLWCTHTSCNLELTIDQVDLDQIFNLWLNNKSDSLSDILYTVLSKNYKIERNLL